MTDLILIGGGHSHAIMLKFWQKNPVPKVNLTLISNVENTPYSGMLPAYLAGYYTYEQTHINLLKLACECSAKLVIDTVTDIDPQHKIITCKSGKKFNFDLVSIDIGSTPKPSEIEGASLYTIPAKPVDKLLTKWQKIVDFYQTNTKQKLSLTIVGGGAGGVELAFNMHYRLQRILTAENLTINLVHRGNNLLENHNQWVSYKVEDLLKKKGINVYLKREVTAINEQKIICQPDLILKSDYIFLVTQAQGTNWLKNSLIQTDNNGFILVKDTLQSLNFDYIFASGDIATMINFPHPKAGVFAVREGKPLYQNLVRFLSKKKLINYQPPSQYLNLIGTGDGSAIASWGYIGWESPLLWQLKKYLDQRFMNKFSPHSALHLALQENTDFFL